MGDGSIEDGEAAALRETATKPQGIELLFVIILH